MAKLRITVDDTRTATAWLDGQVLDTLCLHSRTRTAIDGWEICLKFENQKFTSSFK